MKETHFHTDSGFHFPGVTQVDTQRIRAALLNEIGLTRAQVAEAASYSMAMVARFALGLSAHDASVCAVAIDSLAGEVALATIRHLVNAGATPLIWVVENEGGRTPSTDFGNQINILSHMGYPIHKIPYAVDAASISAIDDALLNCHNVILGALSDDGTTIDTLNPLVETLNEAHTPVHTVDAPLGIDLDTGAPSTMPLYASSTLSLGTPYLGLKVGQEYVGRHYICDISLTGSLYKSCGFDLTPLFAEQPVQKIHPLKEKSE